MSLSKFSGDNLAEDVMQPSVWRMTFKFIPIMELVKLREVCSTFKQEVDFLFGRQEKLGIFKSTESPLYMKVLPFNLDPRYDVPNSLWIRLNSLKQHLPTLKSLFPSVKLLVISTFFSELYIEDILDSFVDLDSLAMNSHIECCDTNRSYPKLKHLFVESVSGAKLVSLPSLESLQIHCKFSKFRPWMKKNSGRPSKRCKIDYVFSGNPDYSFKCLSSLPSSLEYLKTRNFFGYKRRFEPMFPRLMEVESGGEGRHLDDFVDVGRTEFIDFLKDHRLTLKKVTSNHLSFDDEELKDMLSCLSHGTHMTMWAPLWVERANDVRQYGLIGSLCRDRNLYLEIRGYRLSETLDNHTRFLDILPPETQSLTMRLPEAIAHNEASCRRLILEILASPLRSTLLWFNSTEQAMRILSTAILGLPETHEVILEWFEPKFKKVTIRRRN